MVKILKYGDFMSRKFFTLFFLLIAMSALFSGTAFAADLTIDDAYLLANPGPYDVGAHAHNVGDTLTIAASSPVTITGNFYNGLIIDCAPGTYLIVDTLQLEPGAVDASTITFHGASNTLYVVGNSNYIIGATNHPGIAVGPGTTLTFDGDNESLLNVWSSGPFTPTSTAAAIGGYAGEACGAIIIENTTLLASCYGSGAGIGGGANSTGGSVTVNEVPGVILNGFNAESFGGGAGVGGGAGGYIDNINIHGGASLARSYSGGAGVGGGLNSSSGTITIDGGSIFGQSVTGAGIGSGSNIGGTNTGIINISGDYAGGYSSDGGAGIGGGLFSGAGIINISGGEVSGTGLNATGLGAGAGGAGGTLQISGDAFIFAEGDGTFSDIGAGLSSFTLGGLAELYTYNGLVSPSLVTTHSPEPGTILPAANTNLVGVGDAYGSTSPAGMELICVYGYFTDRSVARIAVNPQTGDSGVNLYLIVLISLIAVLFLCLTVLIKKKVVKEK